MFFFKQYNFFWNFFSHKYDQIHMELLVPKVSFILSFKTIWKGNGFLQVYLIQIIQLPSLFNFINCRIFSNKKMWCWVLCNTTLSGWVIVPYKMYCPYWTFVENGKRAIKRSFYNTSTCGKYKAFLISNWMGDFPQETCIDVPVLTCQTDYKKMFVFKIKNFLLN